MLTGARALRMAYAAASIDNKTFEQHIIEQGIHLTFCLQSRLPYFEIKEIICGKFFNDN